MKLRFLPLVLGALFLSASNTPQLAAQTDLGSAISDYFAHWHDRVEAAKASQPDWITPINTTTPRLEEEFRYDQALETLRKSTTVDLYGNGKGLELIPTEHTEIIIPVPAYEVRTGTKAGSGFTDWPGLLLKYRLLSANKQSGDYIVTAFLQYGLPTGVADFTSHNHVITPTIAGGKGWGDFDLQGTLGESIPTDDHSNAGKAILTNLTAQYHVSPLLWPELELNRTDWDGGERGGRSQTFLTAGVIFGRFTLSESSKLIVGFGYQTALSHVYATGATTPTFNHNWEISARVTF